VLHVERAWCYWVAEMVDAPVALPGLPRLPLSLARALNDAPGTGEAVYYGGASSCLGAVARAEGFAGGQPSESLDRPVGLWHIDTQAGLTLFVRWLRENLADYTQENNAREQAERRGAWTRSERMLAACAVQDAVGLNLLKDRAHTIGQPMEMRLMLPKRTWMAFTGASPMSGEPTSPTEAAQSLETLSAKVALADDVHRLPDAAPMSFTLTMREWRALTGKGG
jgi:hypothetical protein